MNKHASTDRASVPTSRDAQRTKLHTLLFPTATFGTVLVTPGGAASPKIPPFVGE